MKKSRILTLVLTIALVAVMAISLFACNDKCTEHVDEDNDFKCDNCGEKISNDNNGGDTTTDDGKEEYTFILRDTDLNPVEGASVMVNVNGTRLTKPACFISSVISVQLSPIILYDILASVKNSFVLLLT